MSKSLALVAAGMAIGSILLVETSCSNSAGSVAAASNPISLVKNGMLSNYPSTTVGKALEGTFQNPKWTTFVSPKGVTVVQFDGTVSKHAIREAKLDLSSNCLDDSPGPCPVVFQFFITADQKAFSLSYYDQNVFVVNTQERVGGRVHGSYHEPIGEKAVLDFIYR